MTQKIKVFLKAHKKNSLIKVFILFYNFYRYKIMTDKSFILHEYKKTFGIYPNIKKPKLFTEKIQWLKLNDENSLYTKCADKYKVREFVENRIGSEYLIPLVFETKDVMKINEFSLPNYPVIIKTNHDSSGGIVVKNKKHVNFLDIQKELKTRLNKNYYYLNREWEYKDIVPRVIVEKLMKDNSGNDLLNDFKIFCFNGKPKYIQTLFDREIGVKESWYDVNWNLQEFRYFSSQSKDVKKPNNLKEMLSLCEKLSKGFRFVRVDLYDVNDKIYFGELTFKPYSGLMKWEPRKWDLILGNELDLTPIIEKL